MCLQQITSSAQLQQELLINRYCLMSKTNYHIEGTKLNDFLIRRRNYQKHQQRLREIQGKRISPQRPDLSYTDTYHGFKQRNRSFMREQRRKEILTYNSKVFDKLVDISSRKPQLCAKFPDNLYKEHHNSFYNQKQQFRRINEQNPSIVHRIMTQVSPLDHKKQEQSFMETRRHKDRLERFPYIKSLDKKLRMGQGVSISSFGERSKRYSTEHSKTMEQH